MKNAPTEMRIRPSIAQALKLHIAISAVGVFVVIVYVCVHGLLLDRTLAEEPLIVAVFLGSVCLLVGGIVLAFDMSKFRKQSPREIATAAHGLSVEMPDGHQHELRWSEILKASSNDLTWVLETAEQKLAFSVAGLSRREQEGLAAAVTQAVKLHRPR